jgi:hypothetical protein
MDSLPDPRSWPCAEDVPRFAAHLHDDCVAALTAATGEDAAACDARIAKGIDAMIDAGDGRSLRELFASAPSEAIYRHLLGALTDVERSRCGRGDDIGIVMFALPVVIIAGIESGHEASATLPAVVGDVDALCTLLREHHALGGTSTFALGNALVGADALVLERLPALLAHARAHSQAAAPGAFAPIALPPSPIAVAGAQESVHLRYLVGAAVTRALQAFDNVEVGRWATPMAKMLARDLAVEGATVLPLPRAPTLLAPALVRGRAAQREISAHVFASNALRRLRIASGEPSAVLSAHRTTEAASGGEVRLSLSTPFATAAAEGFRYPLEPQDRVADVVRMLVGLLAECRVDDVRIMPGVHDDRDPSTGLPLLFKAEAAAGAHAPLH